MFGWRAVRKTALVVAVTVVVSLAMVLGLAGSAAAHDDLQAASPAPDTTIGPVVNQIELMFKGAPSEVQIFFRDGNGDEFTRPATLSGTQLWTMPVERSDLEEGFYAVRWEGVATDGDALEGFFALAVNNAAANAPTIAEQIESGDVLSVDGVAVLDEGPSPLFLILLGISMALGAWTLWLGFNRLGNRLAIDASEESAESEQSEGSAHQREDR